MTKFSGNRFFLFFFVISLLIISPQLFPEVTNDDCIGCHSDKDIEAETERGKKLTLIVTNETMKGSVHEDLSCLDCHTSKDPSVFEDVPHGTKENPIILNCQECHEDTYALYTTTDIHGIEYKKGNENAPSCQSCHGAHDILPVSNPDSRMSRKNQPDACEKCHGKSEFNKAQGILRRGMIIKYKESVHYKAISEGKKGATCTDCHNHHSIQPSTSKDSTVKREELMKMCNSCHEKEVLNYKKSSHNTALIHGSYDVPTCTSCHGDHDMVSMKNGFRDKLASVNISICIGCHDNERMMVRYGLDTVPVKSYRESYHGLARRGSSKDSAVCSDCHDPHKALSKENIDSKVHQNNIIKTCGNCHGKVSENFAKSFSHHKILEDMGTKVETIVQDVYIIIIILSVGGMFLFNFIIWLSAIRKKIRIQRKQKNVRRINRFERIVHIILFTTFIILSVTGFALKFPESWWAKWLFSIGITEVVRAILHRICGVLMTLDIIVLGFYMVLFKRGRGFLWEILPKKRDIADAFKTIVFFLKGAKGNHPPKYAVFNFGEKFEFWALMWGTIVMLVSGLILWFPKMIPAEWPSWVIPVATIVHYLEALLATLAIIVWHFFHVIFHPDEYPMNTSWMTGYITEEEAKHRFEDDAIEKMQESYGPTSKKEKN